jgi:hypothetical protein
MSKLLFSLSTEARAAVSALFENSPPVLVEVRFPQSGTSPDWYLCEEEEQFEQILKRLGAGVELHISSVWDLKNVKGEICLRQ